jgi:uncharacterized glyoxalase superfamily protein PhnB
MIELQAMFPVMVTNNLELIKQFYENVFGFNAIFFDSSFYLHLVSPNNGVQLGFMVPNHESQPAFLHANMLSEGYAISLEVADAQKAYQQAKELSLDVVMSLRTEDWGQRHFIIRDPAGFHIDIVEHLK